MKLLAYVLAIALLAAVGVRGQRPALYPEEVSREVSRNELNNHIAAFNMHAKESKDAKGTRALGTGGFNESVQYVVRRVRRCGKYATYHHQPFNFTYERTNNISLRGPDGDYVNVSSVRYNTRSRPRGFTAFLAGVPVDDKRGSGCFKDQWTGTFLWGSIALIKGGHCDMVDQVKLAKEHGAGAVLFYDAPPRSSLRSENAGRLIPVGVVSVENGRKWSARLASGERLDVKFDADVTVEQREAQNLIAETTTGSPDNVIMLGARLSSENGHGINDNASGCASLVEILLTVHLYTSHSRRIRFAFWGGKMGSTEYASRLNQTEAASIKAYLDITSIGTRNTSWTVFSDEAKDRVAGKVLFNYLANNEGINATYR